MKSKNTKCITESALMVSLSVILSFITVLRMPQGGTVTAGALLPIILLSQRRGPVWGMFTGALSGMIQFVLAGEVIHPVSIIADYILAYALAGTAGFFRGKTAKIILGTIVGCFCRFAAHAVSGAVIFASYAPSGQNPWLYSLLYNGTYMLPELAVTTAEILLLYKFANRLFFGKQ